MLTLGAKDDQTVKDIGQKLHLESNTLTPLLKRLEAMGPSGPDAATPATNGRCASG